ncbi:YdiU family protein [Bacteriovoracaceae bacterium]|nr:YdiU family protein [Bacteriovoracaceae bacterium]
MKINLKNTYFDLGSSFSKRVEPSVAKRPFLIKFNHKLALDLNIDIEKSTDEVLADIFSGKTIMENSKPIAMAYAGHQFGHMVPQLGDGRAILLGEVESDNRFFDIQLKGAGQTPFSRRGDGRSSLGPAVREYILSEAMHALNIPTTRALAITLSGEEVFRESSLPGAVFTRVARGHIRVGTFEYFLYRQDEKSLRKLADYVIQRFYPELKNEKDLYFKLFQKIARKKLSLVAKWMGIGFIHGVMNTDNTSISGETIDYGPCAFMDQFSFSKVFSSIDHQGRYQYDNQGNIALWNLSVLANCFIPLLNETPEKLKEKFMQEFAELELYFEKEWTQVFSVKFGFSEVQTGDTELFKSFLSYLEENKLDFTNSFRNIHNLLFESNDERILSLTNRIKLDKFSYEEQIKIRNQNNPYLIPRNHLVEKAIQNSLEGDYSFFHEMVEALQKPYFEDAKYIDFTQPPHSHEIVHQTFCGT